MRAIRYVKTKKQAPHFEAKYYTTELQFLFSIFYMGIVERQLFWQKMI